LAKKRASEYHTPDVIQPRQFKLYAYSALPHLLHYIPRGSVIRNCSVEESVIVRI
jgi:hypothetical protein